MSPLLKAFAWACCARLFLFLREGPLPTYIIFDVFVSTRGSCGAVARYVIDVNLTRSRQWKAEDKSTIQECLRIFTIHIMIEILEIIEEIIVSNLLVSTEKSTLSCLANNAPRCRIMSPHWRCCFVLNKQINRA